MRLEILDLLVAGRSMQVPDFESLGFPLLDIRAVLENMVSEGLVSRGPSRSDPYRITSKGREYRLDLQQELNEKAEQIEKEHNQESKQERQQRFENKMSVATLLVSVVTFVAGILVEHYSGLFSLIERLLG